MEKKGRVQQDSGTADHSRGCCHFLPATWFPVRTAVNWQLGRLRKVQLMAGEPQAAGILKSAQPLIGAFLLRNKHLGENKRKQTELDDRRKQNKTGKKDHRRDNTE